MVSIHESMQCTSQLEIEIRRRLNGQEASSSTHRHLCTKLEGLDATREIGCDIRGEAANLNYSGDYGSKVRGISKREIECEAERGKIGNRERETLF